MDCEGGLIPGVDVGNAYNVTVNVTSECLNAVAYFPAQNVSLLPIEPVCLHQNGTEQTFEFQFDGRAKKHTAWASTSNHHARRLSSGATAGYYSQTPGTSAGDGSRSIIPTGAGTTQYGVPSITTVTGVSSTVSTASFVTQAIANSTELAAKISAYAISTSAAFPCSCDPETAS